MPRLLSKPWAVVAAVAAPWLLCPVCLKCPWLVFQVCAAVRASLRELDVAVCPKADLDSPLCQTTLRVAAAVLQAPVST